MNTISFSHKTHKKISKELSIKQKDEGITKFKVLEIPNISINVYNLFKALTDSLGNLNLNEKEKEKDEDFNPFINYNVNKVSNINQFLFEIMLRINYFTHILELQDSTILSAFILIDRLAEINLRLLSLFSLRSKFELA